jgi:hypothetical protein
MASDVDKGLQKKKKHGYVQIIKIINEKEKKECNVVIGRWACQP